MGAAVLIPLLGTSSASASTLTSPAGTVYHGAVTASNSGTLTLTGGFKNIECNGGTQEWFLVGGSATETVHGSVSTLTFEACNCEVVVVTKGTLEIHAAGSGNGTLTSSGTKVTVNCSTIFGNVHCIYTTSNTDLGSLTGGAEATMDITATIPQESTNFLCAEESIWHATYKVTRPKPLFVD
jgi:hypothetical protein